MSKGPRSRRAGAGERDTQSGGWGLTRRLRNTCSMCVYPHTSHIPPTDSAHACPHTTHTCYMCVPTHHPRMCTCLLCTVRVYIHTYYMHAPHTVHTCIHTHVTEEGAVLCGGWSFWQAEERVQVKVAALCSSFSGNPGQPSVLWLHRCGE